MSPTNTNTNHIAYLVEQVKAGDSQSFVTLYEFSYQKLYFFALIMLGDEKDAENTLKEVYSKLLHSISSLGNDNHFELWAYKVVYTTCIHNLATKSPDSGSSHTRLKENFMPQLSGINNLTQRTMAQSVLALDDSLRYTIVLTYYQNFSPKDIGLIMSCPDRVVKKRLQSGKNQLMHNLEREGKAKLYSDVPIAIALGSLAGDGLSKENALNILISALEENKVSTDVAFVPQGVYKGTAQLRKTYSKRILIGFFGSILLILLGLFFYVNPKIWAIYPSSTSYVKSLNLEFTVKSALPLFSVSLYDESGSQLELTKVGSGIYRAEVNKNGKYTAYAEAINLKDTETSITLTNIYTEPPMLKDYYLEEQLLVVQFKDEGSGVNYKKIHLVSTDKGLVYPLAIEGDNVIFKIDDTHYTIYGEDQAGNQMEAKLNIVK